MKFTPRAADPYKTHAQGRRDVRMKDWVKNSRFQIRKYRSDAGKKAGDESRRIPGQAVD